MTEISLLLIVVLSTLLFGAVETWSMALVGTVASAAFILFVLRTQGTAVKGSKGILFSLLALLSYGVLQLLPLPLSALDLLQPKQGEIVTLPPFLSPAFHAISVYPFATEMELARLMVCAMVFSLAAYGIRSEERLLTVLEALSVFGFLLALFGIIQHATFNGKIYWFRELTHGGTPFGPFVNRNHFAGFMGMIIPLSLGIALVSGRTEKRVLFGFFSVVMAIALFFSLSRGGILSFLAAMAAFVLLVQSRRLYRRGLVPLFLFLIVLGSYLLYLGVDPVIERFSQTEISSEQRLEVWRATLSALGDFPVLGSGLGTYSHIFRAYQPDGVLLFYDHAHNDYLELLLELGLLGSCAAAVFLFLALRPLIRADWRGRESYLQAALLSSLTSIAVHSLFDFNLHIPSNAILFSLVLGTAVAWMRLAAGAGRADGAH